MSLFICDKCGCVDNTSLNTDLTDNTNYPNMGSMEMSGFGKKYEETGEREDIILLCSECNTGVWHNEFPKEQATEIERIMAGQLEGDMKGIFTFHPLWREYSNDPTFSKDSLTNYMANTIPNKVFELKQVYEPFASDFITNPIKREEPKIGRNETCPCGSGKKYKMCCLNV